MFIQYHSHYCYRKRVISTCLATLPRCPYLAHHLSPFMVTSHWHLLAILGQRDANTRWMPTISLQYIRPPAAALMALAKWQSGENDDDSTRLTPTSEHRVPLLAAHDLLKQLPPPACSSLWKSELGSLGQAAHSQQRNPHAQTVGAMSCLQLEART
ncbi:hypothetical protein LCI18_007984 [Fusarium solani-melongenae]|uniref:Uncharacterized protein n=1 Tax=Fusarium solani subsp. cucurbitae TaxID=2747967 RepID=A0ACD3Z720_FUSSC|nr:hypothetical protein LCI18_007984 [Fusarium solani-melongenae]